MSRKSLTKKLGTPIFVLMTKKRALILEQIRDSIQPLSAQQLYEKLKGSLDQATLYRGLRFLEERRDITSFLLDCSERGIERYYSSSRGHHSHYMHCVSCHSFTAVGNCPLKGLDTLEKETGFKVEEHFLTLKGICRKCREKEV